MIAEGYKSQEIADEFGVHRTTVFDWLKKYDLKLPRGTNCKLELRSGMLSAISSGIDTVEQLSLAMKLCLSRTYAIVAELRDAGLLKRNGKHYRVIR